MKRLIIDFCKSLGLDSLGFTECRVFEELRGFYQSRKDNGTYNEFEEQDIEKRINPKHYFEEGKTIISIAFPYFYGDDYSDSGFSLYTRGNDYHFVVNGYLEKICEFIRSLGGRAMGFTDSNTLPERYIAYLAGVGFIGKNNMVITKKYGSYVFLGEIITDLELENDFTYEEKNFTHINEFSECGDCEICYKECPTKSINSFKNNSNICMSYITQKKDIENKFLKLMNGRLFGCDSCQLKCPYNVDINFSNIEGFKPKEFMVRANSENIISITNSEFKESYKKTSCGWRGKNTLIRNALIKAALVEKKDISQMRFPSEYINDYKARLLLIDK